MKSRQLIYGCLALVWLLAGTASGERVFFVLLAVQLFLLLAGLAANIWAALTFAYTQELSAETTTRGQPVHLLLNIHNEKPVPFPLMRIQTALPDPAARRELNFNLAAGSRLFFDLELECPHRGDFIVGMTVIDFIDLFGLLRLPFDMRLLPYYREKRLLVYPRLIELPGLHLSAIGQPAPSARQKSVDDLMEPFAGVRDYRPGDPGKLIHWKASLRQRKLQTRLFDQSGEPHILLLLDLQPPAGNPEEVLQTIDTCCEAAAALIHTLLGRGWPLRLVCSGDSRREQTGRSLRDFERLHRWLAQVTFSGKIPFHQLLAGELTGHYAGGAILAITHAASPEILSVLASSQRGQAQVYSLFTGPAANDAEIGRAHV